MKIRLAYGKIGLDLSVPDAWNVTLIEPRFAPGLPDPRAALASALRAPIQSPPLRD